MNINKKFFNQSRSYTVDIVVIGRNEGELLRNALNSAIETSNYFHQMGYPWLKIIYVDGQSTDGSVDLARSLGVDTYIVEGKPTPPAGRRLGFSKCHGKYVFFLDGDMELYGGWLPKAVKFLEENEDCAGVGGILDWESTCNGKITWRRKNYNNVVKNVQEVVSTVGGAMVYKREALDKVGGWDPTMVRLGEFELYLRLLSSGYKLFYINVPMALHRDDKSGDIVSFFRRFIFNKNIFIQGVVARRAPKCPSVWQMLIKVYWLHLLHPLLVVSAIIGMALWFIQESMFYFSFSLVAVMILLLTHFKFKQGNIEKTIVSFITMNFYSAAFFIGYLMGWPRVIGSSNTIK